MSKLNGKIAIITGGSSGIGLAAAKKFAAEGAYVFIMGRRQSELDKAKAEIGNNVSVVRGDVANLGDLDRLYQTVRDQKGALDIVVASAGFVERVLTKDATPEHFDKTFGINARGVYFTVQKALPLMRKGGSVVLVSSGLHLTLDEIAAPAAETDDRSIDHLMAPDGRDLQGQTDPVQDYIGHSVGHRPIEPLGIWPYK